jgi:Zn finger protein HypA/HybF involved in hydrogenase expression
MSEIRESRLKPIFVREYPPFALAMGMSFLTWLMGSLAFDSLFGKVRDILPGILFGLIFLGALLTALYSWATLLTLRRIGLYLDESGITYVQPGLLGTRTRSLAWEAVSDIKLEKEILVVETAGEPLRVQTAGLLENPEWILERAKTWVDAVKDKKKQDQTTHRLTHLQAQLEGVVCQSCGGNVDIQLGSAELAKCGSCGNTQGLSDKVKEALKRLSAIIADLPAAHRQFQDKTLRRFVEEGKKHRRTLLGVGWGTAGLWLVFALVSIISDLAEKESKGINYVFPGVTIGLAVLSIVTAYLLAAFIRRVTGTFSLPMQALAPVSAGGKARCRLCGAELPEKGIMRRCEYCQTDSVVIGEQLTEAERMTKKAIQQAQTAVRQSTETAGRLLDSVTFKMQVFSYTQIIWLHTPILVALDGSTGMLIRLTGICLAMLVGNVASAVLGMRWLSKETKQVKNG